MAIYVKVNDTLYLTDGVDGYMRDASWDNRESKVIHLRMSCEEARALFSDGTAWSIVQNYITQKTNEIGLPLYIGPDGEETIEAFHIDPATGEMIPNEPIMIEVTDEFDNSDFNFAGDVTDHRNGTVDVKMGKQTELEEAYEMLFGL